MMLLKQINKPNDIKKLSISELEILSGEIRRLLIRTVSKNGGHLASNLGAVELTIALHYLMDFPEDKLVFDVGHQSYIHKILTGRRKEFAALRTTGGLSGFTNPRESNCDLFFEGHASVAISEGVGLAAARAIKGGNEKIAVLVGDGALTGGLSFEGLNNASCLKDNLTIVLNDNAMSIGKNVGGISDVLAGLRTSEKYTGIKGDITNFIEKFPVGSKEIIQAIRLSKDVVKSLVVPGMIFEDMDITYLGPVDGHNIPAMIKLFRKAFNYKGVCLVHVVTKKGKGYAPAARHPDKFHGVGPFDIKTGISKKKSTPDYSSVFSYACARAGERDDRVCAVSAAMTEAAGLKRFQMLFPDRFFDVGIAEETAVLMGAALAKSGLRPVVTIYSTFLQRAIDQILMNVALNKLPVVFAIDRAGIVGADGASHQGLFDISYLSFVPNMTLMAPKNKWELIDMLDFALTLDGPSAIRYPRGAASDCFSKSRATIEYGKSQKLFDGRDVALIAYGSMVETAGTTRNILMNKGIDTALINARFAKPIDGDMLSELDQKLVVTLEEHTLIGGFGSLCEIALRERGYIGDIMKIGTADEFIPHGNPEDIKRVYGIDAESIAERIEKHLV